MLPQINHPTFELYLPISKITVKYRPMLVKEEKMLLLSKEGNDTAMIVENIKNVLQNCTYNSLNFKTMPLAEVEYLFLNIRSKSINNIISVKITDRYNSNIKHDLDVNLDEVTIRFKENQDNKIMLQDDIGVILRYPNIDSVKRVTSKDEDIGIATFKECLVSIFDAENVNKIEIISEKEVDEFVDSLSPKHIQKLDEFFNNVPRLHFEIQFINSRNENDSVTLETFRDFFS